MKTQLQIKWLLPFLLVILIGGGACSDDEVDWKKEIEGAVFEDFKTTLYVDEIPEAVDKENSTYLYYKTELENGSYGYRGYFHYKKYTAPLTRKSKIIMDSFLQQTKVPVNGISILFSGKMEIAPQLCTGDVSTVYLLDITSIKKK